MIFFEDAMAQIREAKRYRSSISDEKNTIEQEISVREAEVGLAQILVAHIATLLPGNTYLIKKILHYCSN